MRPAVLSSDVFIKRRNVGLSRGLGFGHALREWACEKGDHSMDPFVRYDPARDVNSCACGKREVAGIVFRAGSE